MSTFANDTDTAELILLAGRAKASRNAPYLSTALFAMTQVRTDTIPTLGVDERWRVYWNPAFVATLTVDEMAGAWLHEVGHLIRDHAARFTALNLNPAAHQTWNHAGDAAINQDLRATPDATLPDRVMDLWYPETIPGGKPGMTAEQFFALLRDDAAGACPDCGQPIAAAGETPHSDDPPGTGNPEDIDSGDGQENQTPGVAGDDQPTPDGPSPASGPSAGGAPTPGSAHECNAGTFPGDCGSGAGGNARPWDLPPSDNDGSVDLGRGDLIRHETARQIKEAAKGRGTVPAGYVRWAEDILNPQVDWRTELRAVARRTVATVVGLRDYSYRRPSRRAAATPGVVLPAMRGVTPPRVAMVIDTSGSVSDTELSQVLAEARDLLAQTSRNSRGHLTTIACDAAAADAVAVHRPADIQLSGGGGTDMRVGLEAAAALRPKMDLIITATDGDTPWPAVAPTANPSARYIALLVSGPRTGAPEWMHSIVVDPRQ